MDAATLPIKLERVPGLGMDDAIPLRAAPDAADVSRFNSYMADPAAAAGGGEPVKPATVPEDAVARAARTTPGDSILQGLNRLGEDLGRGWTRASETLKGKEMPDMRDMLLMQVELMGMSMQHELVNKCVTRSTQNLDQLVKLQ